MDFNFSGPNLFRGLLGGFLAAYLVYYIFSFFIGKFSKWEHDKVFKISLTITAVLLFAVSEHTWIEKIVFYTPPIVNIFIMEYMASNRKYCPQCKGKNNKKAEICVHCGKKLAS